MYFLLIVRQRGQASASEDTSRVHPSLVQDPPDMDEIFPCFATLCMYVC